MALCSANWPRISGAPFLRMRAAFWRPAPPSGTDIILANFMAIDSEWSFCQACFGTLFSRASFINNFAKRALADVPTADRVILELTP